MAAPVPSGSTPPEHFSTVFTNAKAGMEGVDKAHVARVVYEMSKGSAHFAEQQRRDAQTTEQVARLEARAEGLDLGRLQVSADRIVAELDGRRKLGGLWACVDMDAFFAAVEELKDPTLREIPFAVGGIGMICTTNYVARRYGVRSAMPGFIGKRLCAEKGVELRFVSGDMKSYQHYAGISRQAFAEIDEGYVATSLDEAYLDLRPWCARHGATPEEAARRLRERVTELTGGLTCSVGIAPNRMLAKVCSDINKPNGQFILPADRDALAAFLSPLSLRKIGGIGKVSERVLAEAVGASTCGQLLERRAIVVGLFNERQARAFLSAALGIGGESAIKPHDDTVPGQKGLSQERTFSPIPAGPALTAKCTELCSMLLTALEARQLQARTLTLKLKSSSFRTHETTNSLHAHYGARSAIPIEKLACRLLTDATRRFGNELRAAGMKEEYRLLGLRATHLRLGRGGEVREGGLGQYLRPLGAQGSLQGRAPGGSQGGALGGAPGRGVPQGGTLGGGAQGSGGEGGWGGGGMGGEEEVVGEWEALGAGAEGVEEGKAVEEGEELIEGGEESRTEEWEELADGGGELEEGGGALQAGGEAVEEEEWIEEEEGPVVWDPAAACLCPVCGCRLPEDNACLNRHVDACLNAPPSQTSVGRAPSSASPIAFSFSSNVPAGGVGRAGGRSEPVPSGASSVGGGGTADVMGGSATSVAPTACLNAGQGSDTCFTGRSGTHVSTCPGLNVPLGSGTCSVNGTATNGPPRGGRTHSMAGFATSVSPPARLDAPPGTGSSASVYRSVAGLHQQQASSGLAEAERPTMHNADPHNSNPPNSDAYHLDGRNSADARHSNSPHSHSHTSNSHNSNPHPSNPRNSNTHNSGTSRGASKRSHPSASTGAARQPPLAPGLLSRPTQLSSPAVGSTAPGEGWSCEACTLINPAGNSRCQMCDALKGSSLPAAATLMAQRPVARQSKQGRVKRAR